MGKSLSLDTLNTFQSVLEEGTVQTQDDHGCLDVYLRSWCRAYHDGKHDANDDAQRGKG